MDQAEAGHLQNALAVQGALLGQHDQSLQGLDNRLQGMADHLEQVFQRLDLISSRLSPPAPPTPPAPAVAVSPATAREPSIPAPARYSGDLGTCGQFLHSCALVFDQQPVSYSSDRAKIAYIMSLLTGKAAQWAMALSNSNSPACHSLERFRQEMSRVFDHPVRGREASQRLLSLRQGSMSVAEYAVDFRILAAESGWNDPALQGMFFYGLSDRIKDELATRFDTTSLEDLISLSVRLDNRLRERRRDRFLAPPHSTLTFPVARPVTSPPSDSPPASADEEPMQLGRSRLSQSERARRVSKGLCLYCGKSEHSISTCPSRPKEQAQQRVGERY